MIRWQKWKWENKKRQKISNKNKKLIKTKKIWFTCCKNPQWWKVSLQRKKKSFLKSELDKLSICYGTHMKERRVLYCCIFCGRVKGVFHKLNSINSQLYAVYVSNPKIYCNIYYLSIIDRKRISIVPSRVPLLIIPYI